jgi:hypothetical protein
MPAPDSANIYCGTGEVWFNRQNTDLSYAGFRHLGNVSKLDLTPTVTVIEKKSSMNAVRAVIARAPTETKMELAMVLDEFEKENVALALLGTTRALVQAANAAVVAGTFPTKSLKGYALDTGMLNITVTDVKMGATTYVAGVDYLVYPEAGLIAILPGGGIADGSVLTWDGSCAAVASFAVDGLSSGIITGRLKFRSSVDAVGPRMIVDIHNVSMSPDTALALLGDTFGEIGLKGSVLPDPTLPIGQQFAQVSYLSGA